MKKIVVMMIIVLGAMSFTTKTKNPFHLIVEGVFLADKNIKYTVYQMNASGDFVAIYRAKARKYYHIECSTGSKYIVRFQNRKGDVKFLMIDAVEYGYCGANVDWRKPYDGKISLEKNGYSLTAFDNSYRSKLLVQK